MNRLSLTSFKDGLSLTLTGFGTLVSACYAAGLMQDLSCVCSTLFSLSLWAIVVAGLSSLMRRLKPLFVRRVLGFLLFFSLWNFAALVLNILSRVSFHVG